jgi:hypothetical protein
VLDARAGRRALLFRLLLSRGALFVSEQRSGQACA